MDTAQWPQGIGVVNKPMEGGTRPMLERRARPQKEQALNCPRCNSINTKFCYYNNYSLSQPRYFCKTCRRYWTEGGSLRNVPVGGGSRKNKRSSTSSSSSSFPPSSKKLIPDLTPPSALSDQSASQNPKIHAGQDLNLAYPPTENYSANNSNISEFVANPAMELLKNTGVMASWGLNSFVPVPVPDSGSLYSSGFALQELKPSLNFSLEGFESGYGGLQGVQESGAGARLLFPFQDLKQVSSSAAHELEQNRGQGDSSTGYWSGMLGGGSWSSGVSGLNCTIS